MKYQTINQRRKKHKVIQIIFYVALIIAILVIYRGEFFKTRKKPHLVVETNFSKPSNITNDVEATVMENNEISDSDVKLALLGDRQVSKDLVEKRIFIRNMVKDCWDVYYKYALGRNEVDPVKKVGYDSFNIHQDMMGITVVDSLDTLLLTGLFEEFTQAKEWVEKRLHFESGKRINLFESNIRVLGGLLSTYYLTRDQLFLTKAKEYVENTIQTFANSFPSNDAIFSRVKNSKRVSLAQVGTLFLEYAAIHDLTKNPKYINSVIHIIII